MVSFEYNYFYINSVYSKAVLELLLVKLQNFSTATLLKIDSNTGVFFLRHCTKMKLFIKDYFSKHDQIHRKLR